MTGNSASSEELGNTIREALEHYQDQGRPLPYLLVACSINGVVTAARYSKGGNGLLTEMLVDAKEVMLLPLNMMLIDGGGEAARILVFKGGVIFH
jgi:hypothetical protein